MFNCQEIKEKIQTLSGVDDLGIKSNKREFSDLKTIYCKLSKQFTISSLSVIANTLRPNYSHASVLHHLTKFDALGNQLTCFDIYMDVFNYYELHKDVIISLNAGTKSVLKINKNKEKNQPTIKQLEATNKAYQLRQEAQNDNDLAEMLGLSKVTLYTRLKRNNWKKPELALIDQLKISLSLTDSDDEYEPYFGWCNVEGCENEGANGGGCWPETGYWTVCSKHAAEYRAGQPQPKMQQKYIDKEATRLPDGTLPIGNESKKNQSNFGRNQR